MKHQHGGDIYSTAYKMDYSANINPLGTPQAVIMAAQEAVLESANYPDTTCRKLVNALAEKEKVSCEHIIVGNGAAELIFAIVHAIRPKKALLIAPGFAEYEQALRANDCDITYYELSAQQDFNYGEDYLDFLKDELDMVFLCNPNNPTGILMEREWIKNVLDSCLQKNIYVVLDSCFIDFLEEEEPYNYVGEIDSYQNLFILKAFTKIYAMAGLRLGYGISANRDLLDRCHMVMQPWSVSIPAQAAGVEALKETIFVEKTKKLINEERNWLSEQLGLLVEKVYDGKANFLFFKSTEDLAERCKKEGILIRDCSNYYGLQKGYYRIAVRTHAENEELIRVFRKILG